MNDMITDLVLLQVGLPLVLIGANTLTPSTSRLGLLVRTAGLLAVLQYSALTGLWLFPPWWTPYVLMVLLILGARLRCRQHRQFRRAASAYPCTKRAARKRSTVGRPALVHAGGCILRPQQPL